MENHHIKRKAEQEFEIKPKELSEFREQGYIAINQLLTKNEISDARRAIKDIVTRYATEPNVAELRSLSADRKRASYKKVDGRTHIQFESGYQPDPSDLDTLELKVRKLMWFESEAPVFQEILTQSHPAMKILEALLGQGSKLFQSMALIKPPLIGSEKPWHQDNAYFAVTPLDAIIGIWIALDDATVDNGCMHVIPGGHRKGAFKHHHAKDCEIEKTLLPTAQSKPIELAAGGALFFYGMLPHETPANRSQNRRRALQFHFHAAHAKKVDSSSYDKVFADAEGNPASCEAARLAGI